MCASFLVRYCHIELFPLLAPPPHRPRCLWIPAPRPWLLPLQRLIPFWHLRPHPPHHPREDCREQSNRFSHCGCSAIHHPHEQPQKQHNPKGLTDDRSSCCDHCAFAPFVTVATWSTQRLPKTIPYLSNKGTVNESVGEYLPVVAACFVSLTLSSPVHRDGMGYEFVPSCGVIRV
jgi:hypothetical protein